MSIQSAVRIFLRTEAEKAADLPTEAEDANYYGYYPYEADILDRV